MLDLDESTVREAVQRLGTIGWSRLASGPGSRAAKYRQLFDEALGLLPSETALLAVLMLRGPQTAAELRARSERLHRFASVPDVEATLERLASVSSCSARSAAPACARSAGCTCWARASRTERVEPVAAEADLAERLARVEERLAELERALAPRDPDEGLD